MPKMTDLNKINDDKFSLNNKSMNINNNLNNNKSKHIKYN